jgi:PHP family Zn ribbon phosphoesterase
LGVAPGGKKVLEIYEKLTSQKPEFEILLDLSEEEIEKLGYPDVAKSILRVRDNQVHIEGGYDGVFGKIHIYEEGEREKVLKKPKQASLF